MIPVQIIEPRSLEGDALAYVLDSWIKSARGAGWCRRMPGWEYERMHRPLVERLASAGCVLLAQCDDLYLGWLCGEPERAVCHYLYAKGSYRGERVATQLVQSFARRIEERAPHRVRSQRVRHTHLPHEGQPGFSAICDWFHRLSWVYCPHALIGERG